MNAGYMILRDAAAAAALSDPELAATLRDMAAEYAGPWTAVNPQVSDEEWAEAQKEFTR